MNMRVQAILKLNMHNHIAYAPEFIGKKTVSLYTTFLTMRGRAKGESKRSQLQVLTPQPEVTMVLGSLLKCCHA
jgi:hypothetical protein